MKDLNIVTSYSEPDLDGTACMYAYTELLKKQGIDARYFIWNTPKQEVKIVCDIFNIKLDSIKEDELKKEYKFIAVDLNGIDMMHPIVSAEQIVEIIDHHGISRFLPSYVNAKIQIERLGAASTLVAERFKNADIIPSRESAILLYYGIISNSVNLKASITSQKDIDMANWLKQICNEISEEKIKEIFIKKSQIDNENLRVEMECEVPNVFKDFKSVIAQLEIANLEEFLVNKKDKIIEILRQVKKEKNLNYAFINCVDILNGYIIVFASDEESQAFVEKTYGYKFDINGNAKINKIIQRKDMTKILRDTYNLN